MCDLAEPVRKTTTGLTSCAPCIFPSFPWLCGMALAASLDFTKRTICAAMSRRLASSGNPDLARLFRCRGAEVNAQR